MAQTDQEDLARWQGLLPRLMLLAPDEVKAAALEDHPELPVAVAI